MANIVFNNQTGTITEEELEYSIAWHEDLGAGTIHLGLTREGQNLVKCYEEGKVSVNGEPVETMPALLEALGNPQLFVPE
jgi:hypothetical protein